MFHGLPLQINYALAAVPTAMLPPPSRPPGSRRRPDHPAPAAVPTTPLPPPSSAAASYGLRPKPISHGAVSDRFEMASYVKSQRFVQ